MSELERIAFTVAAIFAAIALACGGGTANECQSDADCTGDDVCESNVCTSPGADDDASTFSDGSNGTDDSGDDGTDPDDGDGTDGSGDNGTDPDGGNGTDAGSDNYNCEETPDKTGCECSVSEPETCGTSEGACETGTRRCTSGTWGPCEGNVAPSVEMCDGSTDEDCDGEVDENCNTAGECTVPSPSGTPRGKALVIGEAEQACPFPCILGNNGWTADHVPEDSDFEGNLDLSAYDAVVLLDGTEWSTPMPTSGQKALVNFVDSGGGLVILEWIAWEIDDSSQYLEVDELMPVSYAGNWDTAESDYTVLESSHPVTQTLPSSFTVKSHGYSEGTARSGATSLLRLEAAGTPGLVVNSYGSGRVAWFAAANGYNDFEWLSSAGLTEAFARSFDWVANASEIAPDLDVGSVQNSCR